MWIRPPKLTPPTITPSILCPMLPLASASGSAIIGVTVLSAGLFLWWLLRTETGDEAGEETSEEANGDS
jgi:hypothetical protein